jgi:DNA-binding MarR family transcriptional regulator
MKNTAAEKYFCFVELAKKAEEVTDLSPLLADEEKIVNFIAVANAKGERLSVTDILARRELAPTMTMQRKLKALMQKGWIFHEPTEDGRRVQLQLTDKTVAHFSKLSKAMKKVAKQN